MYDARKDVCSCKLPDVTSIAVATGAQFQLTVTPKTLYDGRPYVLRLSQALPVPGENGVEPVTIFDGANAYPVLDEIGNVLVYPSALPIKLPESIHSISPRFIELFKQSAWYKSLRPSRALFIP